MSKEVSFSSNLEQRYREYVEFVNDLVIHRPLTELILVLPSLSMMFDLALKLD